MADLKPFCVRQVDKVRNAWFRPAKAGNVFLSYVGIIAAFAFGASIGQSNDDQIKAEAKQREAGICMVIINVHENAQFRATTARHQLAGTEDYLRDHAGEHNDLVVRVRQNLPVVKAEVLASDQNVVATNPPRTCRPYLPKGK
jgi:hypothetical protein